MIAFYKKLLIMALVLVGLAAFFSSANATETRVGSMGGVGFFTHDNTNIFIFPGAIVKYSGQVVGELRMKNDRNTYTVGVNYPYQEHVFGLYLNRPINATIPINSINGGPLQVNLNQTTDLFYGRKMTNWDFGVKLSIGLDSYNLKDTISTVPEYKESAHYYALAAGLSNEKTDLSVMFELPGAKSEQDSLSNKWSGFAFGVYARTFMGEGKTKLVPTGTFYYRSSSAKSEPGAGKIDYPLFTVGLGIGLNHQINEDNLLVGGLEVLGYSNAKEKIKNGTESTHTWMVMPALYMGVESKIKPWLTGRIGAAEVFQTLTDKVKPQGGKESESKIREMQYKIVFGLGLHFGSFDLDAMANEGLFFDGPNFISGSTNPWASKLSLTYNF
jgi:hypothetical protein